MLCRPADSRARTSNNTRQMRKLCFPGCVDGLGIGPRSSEVRALDGGTEESAGPEAAAAAAAPLAMSASPALPRRAQAPLSRPGARERWKEEEEEEEEEEGSLRGEDTAGWSPRAMRRKGAY